MKQSYLIAARDYKNRIMGMMIDYQLTMREAIERDFEGFGLFWDHLEEDEKETELQIYLLNNGLHQDQMQLYIQLMLEQIDDFVLTKNK